MRAILQAAWRHRITDSNMVLTILNIMYGVFLGVFAQYLINVQQDSSAGVPTFRFLVNQGSICIVSLFFIYFIFDWFSANITLLFHKGANHLVLITAVVLIVWLGIMVVGSLHPSHLLFLSFAVYSMIGAFLDITVKYSPDESLELRTVAPKIMFFLTRFLLASSLFLFSILLVANPLGGGNGFSYMSICYLIIVILVAVKIWRYLWLVRMKEAQLSMQN